MDASLLLDTRFAAFSCMLFTTVVAITAGEPETIPSIFQLIWRRYQRYQEIRRIRSSEATGGRFWEVDMTKFEP